MSTKRVVGWILAGLVAGCGGAAAEGGGAETVPAQYDGPVQSQDVAGGEQLFNDVCGACHVDGDAPNLNEHAHSAAMVRMTVREGDGQMPPLSAAQLSDEDLEAILAYMASVHAVN